MSGRRWWVSRTLVASVAAGVAVALASAGWAAFWPLPATPREAVYVIPEGAAAAAGHHAVLPRRLRFTVGVRDVLVLRNDDDVPATFGPVLLGPHQTYRMPFRAPAEFRLACSVQPGGAVTIVVVPAPERGWPRLRWRLAELFDS